MREMVLIIRIFFRKMNKYEFKKIVEFIFNTIVFPKILSLYFIFKINNKNNKIILDKELKKRVAFLFYTITCSRSLAIHKCIRNNKSQPLLTLWYKSANSLTLPNPINDLMKIVSGAKYSGEILVTVFLFRINFK